MLLVVCLALVLTFGGFYLARHQDKDKGNGWGQQRLLGGQIAVGAIAIYYLLFAGGYSDWLFSCSDLLQKYIH